MKIAHSGLRIPPIRVQLSSGGALEAELVLILKRLYFKKGDELLTVLTSSMA